MTPPFSSVAFPFRRPGIDGIEGIAGIAGIETVGIEGIAGIDGMDAFPSQPVTLDDTPEKTPPFVGLLSPSSPAGAAAAEAADVSTVVAVATGATVAVAAEFGGVGTSSSCGSPLAAPIHELTWLVNPENIFESFSSFCSSRLEKL